jgi:hypothetical protein
MSKVCSKCGESKPIEAFSKNRTTADGLDKRCKTCAAKSYKEYYAKNREKVKEYKIKNKEKIKEYNKEYRIKNKEQLNENDRKRYAENKEKMKEYRIKNRDKRAKQAREWNKTNPEKVQANNREWLKNNPDKNRHKCALRRSARMQRTPCWLTEDDMILIQRKYTLAQKKTESTGEKWVVDHILPLRGKLVSGLHVPANLRVIKETTNARKYNKYTPV